MREALAAPPDVTVGDEVFARGLPSSLGLKASRDEIHGQFFVDPEHYVKDTVIPIHRFYLGLTDLSSTRRKIPRPPGVMTNVLHEKWKGIKTWADLQGRMNQQRAVGLLWNHANEAHRTVRRENHKVDFLDWGPHSEGVFASEEYLKCVYIHPGTMVAQ